VAGFVPTTADTSSLVLGIFVCILQSRAHARAHWVVWMVWKIGRMVGRHNRQSVPPYPSILIYTIQPLFVPSHTWMICRDTVAGTTRVPPEVPTANATCKWWIANGSATTGKSFGKHNESLPFRSGELPVAFGSVDILNGLSPWHGRPVKHRRATVHCAHSAAPPLRPPCTTLQQQQQWWRLCGLPSPMLTKSGV
jgi:hypothetical protein